MTLTSSPHVDLANGVLMARTPIPQDTDGMFYTIPLEGVHFGSATVDGVDGGASPSVRSGIALIDTG